MPHLVRLLAVGAAASAVLGACSTSDSARPPPPASSQAAPTTPVDSSTPTAGTSSPAPDPGAPSIDALPTLEVVAGDVRLVATLLDNAPARDLVAQLPVTVEMSDHGGVEKTGRLPSSLSTQGMPDGDDPLVGDLGYYAPGQDLVLYYGNQDYYTGIMRLGTMDGDLDALAQLDGDVEVSVRVSG